MINNIIISKIFFILLLVILPSCKFTSTVGDSNKLKDLEKLDSVIFQYLLTSYMWHSPLHQVNLTLSTDELSGQSFEWVRFRSAIGNQIGHAVDYCFGIKNHDQNISFSVVEIGMGQTCDGEANKTLAVVSQLKRVIWHWPKNNEHNENKENKYPQLQLDFEWIENAQWKKTSFTYDLPHYPLNHKIISWGKTWRNQNPVKKLALINPQLVFFLKSTEQNFSQIKLTKISHAQSSDWQNAQVCFAVDDECNPIMLEQCHLCEKGYFTLYNSKCKTHGTTYCGEIHCGQKGQPACYLGQHHIKQDDFKGCSPFTEEWFCQQGLEIKCTKAGAICY